MQFTVVLFVIVSYELGCGFIPRTYHCDFSVLMNFTWVLLTSLNETFVRFWFDVAHSYKHKTKDNIIIVHTWVQQINK